MPNNTRTQVEEWRDIPGWEGYYQVSNLGRVKSVERTALIFGGHQRRVHERLRKPFVNRGGRLMVRLNLGDTKPSFLIHRLVLQAFVGPEPEGMEACHNNGDHTDNRLENLRWDTKRSNMLDKRAHGTDHQVNKTHCPRGHLLASPNLVPSLWERKGRRGCLSCSRAQSYISYQKHEKPNFQKISDSYYQDIIKK